LDVAESTSNKTLFISRASQMDREIPKKIFNFFREQFILDYVPFRDEIVEDYIKQYRNELLAALKFADSDIEDIQLKKELMGGTQISFVREKGKVPVTSIANIKKEVPIITTSHKKDPEVRFDFFTEESAGTVKLFYAFLTIIDVVRKGKTLLIDELETSLHPIIQKFILELFHKSQNAQLIFSTHNTVLLDRKLIRKDQIYFCEKNENAFTELYSLYDFKDFREGLDLGKAYLQGRFKAVPIINNSESAIEQILWNVNE
jgi:AAA15 family ATPase/GTPase